MKNYCPSYLYWKSTDLPAEKERRLQLALIEHPEDVVAVHYQIALHHLIHRSDESFEKMKAAASYLVEQGVDAEDRSTGYELMAICYEHLKEDDATAAEYYTASLQHDPANDSSLFRLGHIHMRTSKYREAWQCFQTLEQQEPGAYQAELGEACLELKEYGQAEKHLEAALAKRGTVAVYNGLGRCAAEQGDYEKGMDYFRRSLDESPEDAVTNYYVGLVYQEREDYYRALHHYTKAVCAWPAFSDAYNNMALCYDSLGDDPQAAVELFEKALGTDPSPQTRSQLYLNLARFHGQRKNFALQEHYQRKLLQDLGFEPEDEGE